MRIRFREHLALPPAEVYAFFRTPEDWARLYGLFGEVRVLEDGWRAVPLQAFPWPLVARITEDRPLELVRWRFGGIWEGEGELHLEACQGGVVVWGHEQIRPRGWRPLTALAERLFLERRFRRMWAMGFRRLHRRARDLAERGAAVHSV